jgi:hypothetical protein
MQQAMEYQDANFGVHVMALGECLLRRPVQGNRNFSQLPVPFPRRKGKHVGGVVLASKTLVQLTQLLVGGDQTGHRCAGGHLRYGSLEKGA